MQTIITKQLSPTNYNGSRIKAKASYAKTYVTVGYNYALSNEQNHRAAAEALARKLDWVGYYGGGYIGADSYVFINIDDAKASRMTFDTAKEEVPA